MTTEPWTPPSTACPTCGGYSMPGHVAGHLAWKHSNTCTIHLAEDATHAADHARLHHLWRGFQRDATSTERQLLTVIGFTPLPADLATTVVPVTASVHERSWPELAEPTA